MSTEWVWRVFLNHKPTGECIERFDMITPDARGWDALTDIDTALAVRGFTRSTSWEIGSGHGFVAWIEA